ncbi:restriction endonuclease subunit S [Helicobacter pylori]|uniref:restriction endonuclease subunit S n=2 Tax=Helicobacter pylori TaxID=210 RepID=UPI002927AFA7|nr:restriction endonuclease subunit S [Helicobacter pylori]MDU9805993.1 restriction endonuclease subunit S [Helicobacter pylori]
MDALMLPSNWQRVRLGDIAEIIGGGTPSTQITSFWSGSINWFTPTEIGITKYVYKSQRTITPLGLKKSSAKLLPIGTILLTSRASIGDCAILKVVATTNQGFQSLIPLEKINNEFLYYLILTLKNKLLKLASGSTFLEVSPNKIKNLLIPLPPLNEQIAIANILSALDHYLYSLDALILKKESVKKALSFELLSQRKRLKGFNQAWQKVRLGTYKYRRGSFPQPYGNPQWYSDNGMPFVQVYDVGENFKLTQKTKQKISKIAQPMSVFVPKNSVIITLQGTIGRVALTQYDCYCDRTILIFDNNTLNDVNKYFFVLSLFTKFEEEKRKADGSIIKTITKQTLKDFEIFLPPLNEQIAIANILSTLDHEIISLKNKKRQFENIKKALNHDLMSAKIRVLKE